MKHQTLKEMSGNRVYQKKNFQLSIPIVSDNQVLKEGRRTGLGLGERWDPGRQGQGRGCGWGQELAHTLTVGPEAWVKAFGTPANVIRAEREMLALEPCPVPKVDTVIP